MAVSIITPSFEIPPLEDLVRNEDGEPIFTQVSHGLQATNQVTLWELFLRSGLSLPKGPVLDAGCGNGLFLALAPYMVFSRPEIGRRLVIGVDKDRGSVRKARAVAALVVKDYAARTISERRPDGLSLTYIVQDAQDLAAMEIDRLIVDSEPSKFPQVAMVWSNSVFHWISDPRDKYEALARINMVMKDRGVLCISMSAGGTARDFLDAYNYVVRRHGAYSVSGNIGGYRRAELVQDPIGSRPVDELVGMVEESGFNVAVAVTLAESVVYADPRQYAHAVRIYGRDTFLKPLSHTPFKFQNEIWDRVVTEFVNTLRRNGWEEGTPWTYTQFNNYVVAAKGAAPESLYPEGRLLRAILGERRFSRERLEPFLRESREK